MHVSLIAAITLDGFIGKDASHRSTNWTSPEDLRYYVDTIKAHDLIIVGSNTFKTFHKYPKNSKWVIYTSHPETFTNPSPNVIETYPTKESPAALLQTMALKGFRSAIVAGGASLYTQFLAAKLVNKLYLTLEPYLFGTGVKLLNHDVQETRLQLEKHTFLNTHTLALEYRLNS